MELRWSQSRSAFVECARGGGLRCRAPVDEHAVVADDVLIFLVNLQRVSSLGSTDRLRSLPNGTKQARARRGDSRWVHNPVGKGWTKWKGNDWETRGMMRALPKRQRHTLV